MCHIFLRAICDLAASVSDAAEEEAKWFVIMRITDSCLTQLKAHGPSRTCNESKVEEKKSRI